MQARLIQESELFEYVMRKVNQLGIELTIDRITLLRSHCHDMIKDSHHLGAHSCVGQACDLALEHMSKRVLRELGLLQKNE